MDDFETTAEIIALAVESTDTDFRGNLFEAISKKLRSHNQYYTASLFMMIAKIYGVKDA